MSGIFIAVGSSEAPVHLVGPGYLAFTEFAPQGSLLVHCSVDGPGLRTDGRLPLLDHCVFEGQNSSLEMWSWGSPTDVTIRDCTFRDNTNLRLMSIATLIFERNVTDRLLDVVNAQTIHIVDNIFQRINLNPLDSCFNLDQSHNVQGTIRGNTFVGDRVWMGEFAGEISHNTFSVRVVNSENGQAGWFQNDLEFEMLQAPIPGGTDVGLHLRFPLPGVVLNDNNFIQLGDLPPGVHDLLSVYRSRGLVIDAERNWWGPSDAAAIEDLIVHFVDQNDRAFVDFVPFRTNPVGSCQNDADCPDDGVFCNGPEICVTGVCEGSGIPCEPDMICNEAADRCDQCVLDADCDNVLLCDGVERCVDGQCQPGTPYDCDDGVTCTVDTCVEAPDPCIHTPNDELCDDGDDCTVDACNTEHSCEHSSAPDGTGCEDGVFCTINDTCVGGVCTAGEVNPWCAGTHCWDLNGDGIADPEEDVNGDGAHDTFDCQGPPGPQGSQGPPGPTGPQGPGGSGGPSGQPGVSCWDLNGDGIGDPEEDINGDGDFNALDCRGEQGLTGPEGPQGEQGEEGVQGEQGAAGISCWDLDGDRTGDPGEDTNGDGNFDALDCQGPPGISDRPCETDADCFDGLFCNGVEACSGGTCVRGTPPCDLNTEVCLEDSDECVPEEEAGQEIPDTTRRLNGAMCGAAGPAMILIFLGLVGLRFVGARRPLPPRQSRCDH